MKNNISLKSDISNINNNSNSYWYINESEKFFGKMGFSKKFSKIIKKIFKILNKSLDEIEIIDINSSDNYKEQVIAIINKNIHEIIKNIKKEDLISAYNEIKEKTFKLGKLDSETLLGAIKSNFTEINQNALDIIKKFIETPEIFDEKTNKIILEILEIFRIGVRNFIITLLKILLIEYNKNETKICVFDIIDKKN